MPIGTLLKIKHFTLEPLKKVDLEEKKREKKIEQLIRQSKSQRNIHKQYKFIFPKQLLKSSGSRT